MKEEVNKDLQKKEYIEVWEDLIAIKDLVLSIVLCLITTFAGYFIAPNNAPWTLFGGLIGAITGFVINSFIIAPKRQFIEDKEE